jgi:hypothetical protein
MPPDTSGAVAPGRSSELYGPDYYASHCGPVPYSRNDHWLSFFGRVADELVRAFAPRRVFDAGCALGLLVECLWDRGVEAHGRDLSGWAISEVRADVRPFCAQGAIADPIIGDGEGEYDLLTCIEVVEHMPEADALRAVKAMAAAAPRILFSSSPTDLDEPTHCTVRPPAYWLARWAEAGFAPLATYDAGYLAPHAYVLERSETGRTPRDLAVFADRVRQRVAMAALGTRLHGMSAELAGAERERAALDGALARAQADLAGVRAELARRETEDRRLRAAAAQRAAEARAEAQAMRTRATELERALAEMRRDVLEAQAAWREMATARDNLLASTTWRATWPLRAGAGLLPHPVRRRTRQALTAAWWTATGQLGPRLRARREVAAEAHAAPAPATPEIMAPPEAALPEVAWPPGTVEPGAIPAPALNALAADPAQPPTLDALLRERFPGLEPLRTYAAPHDAPRVTVVTDSINAGSLYGGVGTALVLAALLARRLGAGLRLVTRTEPPDAANIGAVLGVHGIPWDGNVDLLHAPPGPDARDVPVGPRDVFLTTSWWTTWATRRGVSPARIAYLLQEDERGFYPLGDDHLRCTETLTDPALLYVVNAGLLLDHLRAEGLAPGAVAFEPAFPLAAYHPEARDEDAPRRFFFYARPHNPRNLYWRGLEALGAAIEEGVLDPASWTVHLVGHGAQDLVLPRGVRPELVHGLPWADYAGLVRRMDLGLSLMDTPHPSYPPLDLAACGAVVVTNRFGGKAALDQYSANILVAEPTVPGLVEGLRRGAALALDGPARAANYARNGLQRDWETALAPALDRLAARFGG